jgi:hypothetical protein
MEAKFSPETSVDFQGTTRRYILECRTLHNRRCENLKSYNAILYWSLYLYEYIHLINTTETQPFSFNLET